MKKIGKLKINSSDKISDSLVSIGFETLDRDLFTPEKCYDILGKSGVGYARCQTGWAKTEKEKGVYDFKWLDSVVDGLINVGVKPWFCVSYGNPVYMPDSPNPTGVGCVPLYYGSEGISAWENYVRALVRRFKDRVDVYEIWNEPGSANFWYNDTPDLKKYGELVLISSKIIKEEYPDAKVAINLERPHMFKQIEDTLSRLSPRDIDIFTFHPYSKRPEKDYIASVKQARAIFDNKGFTSVEFWQGESGFASWFPKGHWFYPEGHEENEKSQAVWQLRRYFLDIYAGCRLVSFYQMVDLWEKAYTMATSGLKKNAAHGILHGLEYTPKESYRTISHLAQIFSGNVKSCDRFIGGDISGASVEEELSCVYMSFEKNKIPFYAYYIPSDLTENREFDYSYCAHLYEPLESPVLLDMYTGDVFKIEKIGVEEDMICYFDLPIKDYPLVICDEKMLEIV